MPNTAKLPPITTLQEGFSLFETVGMPARDLSERTRKEYAADLADVIAYLTNKGVTQLADVDLAHLEGYQAEMDRRKYKSSTRRRKTLAIKIFFAFLHRQEVIARDVTAKLIPPRVRRDEPRFLSTEEYQALLRACSHHPRDAAIVELFLQTGMRLSELARLTINDIELPKRIDKDPDNVGTVRIRRKGGAIDTIPLNHKACKALKNWLKARPGLQTNALFISKFAKPLNKRSIQHALKKYLEEAGITDASVHTLRHTMATHHAAQGTDAKTIQETLGHASLTTTELYISLAKKTQRRALQDHAL